MQWQLEAVELDCFKLPKNVTELSKLARNSDSISFMLYRHEIFRLAKITSAPEDRRNVSELYKRMPLHKLEELVPEVRWRRYLCIVMNRTVDPNETVVLFALSYVRVCDMDI